MMDAQFCGRTFTEDDLDRIRSIIATADRPNRTEISRRVCRELGWVRHDGRLKDMSCRVALLRMHRRGLISLPSPERVNANGHRGHTLSRRSAPQAHITAAAGQFHALSLHPVTDKAASALWNEYMQRYHYLGYQPLPGDQTRYFVKAQDQLLALLGFGAAAWKTAPRDNWIGWTPVQRQEKLHLIVNNARFLILPWVTSRNLASKILSMAAARLPEDWHNRYGYRPVLMETFVEKARFMGTCYKAANWIYLGDTQGRGKLDVRHQHSVPAKAVFVYPLTREFRQRLAT